MLEIVLVRHGRPVCDARTPIRGSDFGTWARSYDEAPLDESLAPPADLCARAQSVACVITSTLRRARESAALLAPARPILAEAMFDEAALPRAGGFGLALRPSSWDVLTRAAWLCGWSGNGESLSAARTRARRAAERLAGLARSSGSVMLVGHGMMNALIRQELRRSGWRASALRFCYWGVMVASGNSAKLVLGAEPALE
jgi:broad specificity phosphatase PhoE